MRLEYIADELRLNRLTPKLDAAESRDVRCCHASDCLSEVLSNAPDESLLITAQADMYVLAVAVVKKVVAVVFPSGTRPEKAVIDRAIAEGVPLYASEESAFTLAGRLYSLGLRGSYMRPHSPAG